MKKYLSLLPITLIAACTSVQVKPLDYSYHVLHVCIKDNPAVIVPGFIEVIDDLFQNHLISTEVYSRTRPDHCEFKLTYTATRNWDFAPYLSHAELRLFQSNTRIAQAEYHLRGGGGMSLMKWSSVKSKMTPVVNKLLAEY